MFEQVSNNFSGDWPPSTAPQVETVEPPVTGRLKVGFL